VSAVAVPLLLNAASSERRAAIRERLQRTGRAQVVDVLTAPSADALFELARAADYNVVTRRGTGHVDLPSAWLASLEPNQKRGLGEAIQKSAATDFQYLYDNYPVFDLVQDGRADARWRDLAAFLNGEDFLDLMRDLTGEQRIAMADMQVTRYRPGHFLTEHDDYAEGKNRYYAYVLNLTPGWLGRAAGLPRRGRQCVRGLHTALQYPEPAASADTAFGHSGGAVCWRRSDFDHGLAARSLRRRDEH